MNLPRNSVFMIAAGSSPDDISSLVKSQAESLRVVGWDVSFGIVDDRTTIGGIWRNVLRIRQEVARTAPALVHAQYGSIIATVGRWSSRSLPLIVSFCGDDLLGTPEPGLIWRVREKLARRIGLWSTSAASAVCVKSDNLYRELPGRLREKAIILPNGVDIGDFRPMPKDECREKLGWNAETKVVLFNASKNNNQHVKNPALAREAVRLLSESVTDVTLHMMSGARRKEVILMLNAADCLLVTSLHEGSPNIVKEAMACNLPIVSVPCGDVEERLRNTSPGGVSPYDASALADAIHEVLRVNVRSNGREQLTAQGLSADKVAERLAHIYRSLISNSALPEVNFITESCAE